MKRLLKLASKFNKILKTADVALLQRAAKTTKLFPDVLKEISESELSGTFHLNAYMKLVPTDDKKFYSGNKSDIKFYVVKGSSSYVTYSDAMLEVNNDPELKKVQKVASGYDNNPKIKALVVSAWNKSTKGEDKFVIEKDQLELFSTEK